MSAKDGPTRMLFFDEYAAPARRLARAAGLEGSQVEVHRFPDGESRLRLPASLPKSVVLVRSLDHPNAKLIELLLAAQTARELGAEHLTLVAPYLCYMRQDKAFRPGEAVSQRVITRFLAGQFDRLLTVDPHLHRTKNLDLLAPGLTTVVLSATGPIAAFLEARVDRPLLVGPDEESEQWVAAIAECSGLDYAVGTKRRRGDADVEVSLPARSFADRNVVLVDDIASTGRSLVAVAKAVAKDGPRSISAVVTHGIFADDALAKLAAAGIANVWTTDSVSGCQGEIELAGLIADAL
ncbi:ribose-phosphate diphosphokinase [Engelhardtia mirabilis]|uniref:Ribose-phosphate pyrophosphokinase 2 n=1 Tax=Engelhardtia mirabilis TaxID=2528011 RepID=A0A518BE27_9BACT|nr:Ribose-phosphate pyrophosphokinase 2 [Planctomycetes bacterium Pla133]QDU99560.1 Ribose-phosphate pyrophosphokinase 2 [Planctomycetes bacterium Pla86]